MIAAHPLLFFCIFYALGILGVWAWHGFIGLGLDDESEDERVKILFWVSVFWPLTIPFFILGHTAEFLIKSGKRRVEREKKKAQIRIKLEQEEAQLLKEVEEELANERKSSHRSGSI